MVNGEVVAPSLAVGAVRSQVGSQLTFSCDGSAIPTPNFNWFLNEDTITNSDAYSISQSSTVADKVTSTLVVKSANKNDAGDFTCVASSAASWSGDSKSVDITGKRNNLLGNRLELLCMMFRCRCTAYKPQFNRRTCLWSWHCIRYDRSGYD